MNLNDKLKQERTGLTASQYSYLQELFEFAIHRVTCDVAMMKQEELKDHINEYDCLLYTSPSPRDRG